MNPPPDTLEHILVPLSPAGGSDEPTEGQTSRPRREGPGGSDGRVRGFQDALIAVTGAATAEPHSATEGELSSVPPPADQLSNPPPKGRSADSRPQPIPSADSAQYAEEARRKEWARASRIAIRHRLPLEVLSPVSEAVRAAPAFDEKLVKELDERFELRRKYRISPSGLRAFLFRIRNPRSSVTRTTLAGVRRRQLSVAAILKETFGEKGKKNPFLWEQQAFLSLVGLVFERLITNEKQIPTEELVTLSKLLAEQRRAETQSRDGADPPTAPVAVAAEGELPEDIGDAVKQIYGTNFQAPS